MAATSIKSVREPRLDDDAATGRESGTVLLPGVDGDPDMIGKCILRLLIACGLALLGVGMAMNYVAGQLGYVVFGIAALWGIVELFILSALLLTYGLTGLFHDFGQTKDHDPWGRW